MASATTTKPSTEGVPPGVIHEERGHVSPHDASDVFEVIPPPVPCLDDPLSILQADDEALDDETKTMLESLPPPVDPLSLLKHPLPHISVRTVDDPPWPLLERLSPFIRDEAAHPEGVEALAVTTGGAIVAVNGDFRRPGAYVRQTRMRNRDVLIEYDMDSEDEVWLNSTNRGRRTIAMLPVTEGDVEEVIDRLEKESHKLTVEAEQQEEESDDDFDSYCSVCFEGDSDDTNRIVFCDGCNIAVHQACYGIKLIPEGRWLCRLCEANLKAEDVECVLCPLRQHFAFKPTTIARRWVHSACAWWIPGTKFGNLEKMEPIYLNGIIRDRFRLTCYLCGKKKGACLQCSHPACVQSFHVSCARRHFLHSQVIEDATKHVVCRIFCDEHSANYAHRLEVVQRRERKALKKKNAVPEASLISLARALRIIKLPASVVEAVYEYWARKRKGHGGPLFRIEKPESFPRLKLQDTEETRDHLEKMLILRKHFEWARMLAELARKREQRKKELVMCRWSVLELEANPLVYTLRKVLDAVLREDRNRFFHEEVSRLYVPDYYETVTHPIDLAMIREKVNRFEYREIGEFRGDLERIVENARIYNGAESMVFKEGRRVVRVGLKMLEGLEGKSVVPAIPDTLEKPANVPTIESRRTRLRQERQKGTIDVRERVVTRSQARLPPQTVAKIAKKKRKRREEEEEEEEGEQRNEDHNDNEKPFRVQRRRPARVRQRATSSSKEGDRPSTRSQCSVQ